MIIHLTYQDKTYHCDLDRPLDISIVTGKVNCFHAPEFLASPHSAGDFIGSVKQGAPINFYNISLSPHGNGTHTECLGHITKKQESISDQLRKFHFISRLITVDLQVIENGDQIISLYSLEKSGLTELPEAVILRTIPNTLEKLSRNYSGTNPAYLEKRAMNFLVDKGVKHLLIDLPSVDREEDGGDIPAHRIFWNVGPDSIGSPRKDCTITELIYADSTIVDGLYLLNIQIPSIALDAAPSKPVLYKMYDQDLGN